MSGQAGRVILGLDPGTASTGWGVISVMGNRFRMVEYGVVRTSAKMCLEARLRILHEELSGILRKHRPDATAVESLFFNTNVSTALAVGHARGVALLACAQCDSPVSEYTPQQVKTAVAGYGKASKEQVMEMVRALLALKEAPRPDHAADALGVAICHANSARMQEKIAREVAGTDGRAR